MGFSYTVLGAGRQGVALAYDLAKNCQAARILLADADAAVARAGAQRVRTLIPGSTCAIDATVCDVARREHVEQAVHGADVVLSAVPYRYNLQLTEAAIAAGANFNDLGGNTDVVRSQLALHERALKAGVSVVPDCGLAPGLGNILAAYGVSRLDHPRRAHVRCGGLPQERVGPLHYKMLFNFQGLINEYSGFGEFLRGGEKVSVPALTDLELIEFPEPIGRCEAAVTSGGTSTCADTFFGRLESYDYKTIRYPGHFAVIRAMFELGCFEERVTLPDGGAIEPKAVLRRLMEERLAFPETRDLTLLRATVEGERGGRSMTLQYDLFDKHDERTGFTAMERTTAFPTTLVAHLQARGRIEPGARPLQTCIPLQTYMDELPRHDIHVTTSER